MKKPVENRSKKQAIKRMISSQKNLSQKRKDTAIKNEENRRTTRFRFI